MLVGTEGRDWERYLPHLLFAYREVPQASTGFSHFELVYGRRVGGPLDLIKDCWEDDPRTTGVSVVEYVLRLRERMQKLSNLAHENVTQAQINQKVWYDRNARLRAYEEGQKVWVLVPMLQNKLQVAWEGPYTVHKRLNDVNYVVTLDEHAKHQKVFHVNMLKAHHAREACVLPVCSLPEEGEADLLLDVGAGTQYMESLESAEFNPELSHSQRSELMGELREFTEVFTGEPGRTHLAVYHVDTGTNPPVQQSAYRVSAEVKAHMREQVEEMLKLKVIQKSQSAWASPVVLVPKKDRTTRFRVDYRKLNVLTTCEVYPLPRIDELLEQLAKASYLTIMELSRCLYLSRKLLPREVAYATIEKESLAIVWALQKLQPYLYGGNFTVITDHNPLSWLNRVVGDNGKLLRLSFILQQYDFTIQHKKGVDHGNADGLSRQDGAEPDTCSGADLANIFRSALQIIEGTCTDNKHYIITEIQFKTDTRRSEGPARKLTNYGEKGRHERIKESSGWQQVFSSPYLDWTIERVALNAKVVGGPHGDKDKMVAVASESSIILWSIQDGSSGNEIGVFNLGVPVDALFFIGNQLVATSHTGKVGVWNAVTQHWQVQDVVPITSYDTAGSFLLLGCNNGSIYYIGNRFPLYLHKPFAPNL
ncbi:unnamed protein product [Ranitomeya imitator]|uniref:Reverse transcriptase RNase H-like domain-containing protein n=1 Tax=Ranitomeya imitator TaxID=111125 RepID=A0ABN9KYI0_9NEOB|nr:unnamed protein product [Ranitomeya imitator]